MALDIDALIAAGRFVGLREWPGYGVSDDGRIWSCRRSGPRPRLLDTWHEIRPASSKRRGVQSVVLRRDGGGFPRLVHHLILEGFVGPRPDGMECCHADDDPGNNAIGNLRWDTYANNRKDAIANGRLPKGSEKPLAKLTEADIPIIIELRRQGVRVVEIARQMEVTVSAIYPILKGRRWTHVPR